jgi:hypothetical protein
MSGGAFAEIFRASSLAGGYGRGGSSTPTTPCHESIFPLLRSEMGRFVDVSPHQDSRRVLGE